MPPKVSTLKMMHRAGDLRHNQTKQKQSFGRVCAHIGWLEFSSADNKQLEIMWWTFPKGTLCSARHEGK